MQVIDAIKSLDYKKKNYKNTKCTYQNNPRPPLSPGKVQHESRYKIRKTPSLSSSKSSKTKNSKISAMNSLGFLLDKIESYEKRESQKYERLQVLEGTSQKHTIVPNLDNKKPMSVKNSHIEKQRNTPFKDKAFTYKERESSHSSVYDDMDEFEEGVSTFIPKMTLRKNKLKAQRESISSFQVPDDDSSAQHLHFSKANKSLKKQSFKKNLDMSQINLKNLAKDHKSMIIRSHRGKRDNCILSNQNESKVPKSGESDISVDKSDKSDEEYIIESVEEVIECE